MKQQLSDLVAACETLAPTPLAPCPRSVHRPDLQTDLQTDHPTDLQRARRTWHRGSVWPAVVLSLSLVIISPFATGRAALLAQATDLLDGAPKPSLFLAQTQSKKSARDLRMGRGNRPSSRPGTTQNRTATKKPEDEKDPTAASDADKAASSDSPGGLQSIIRAIRDHAVWIVIGLVCAIAGVLAWVMMGGRSSTDDFDEELDGGGAAAATVSGGRDKRYSTTKIRARDVNDRLAVDGTEVETDREYALVVDEDALKKPEVDERTGQVYADASAITDLLEEERFDEAYETYSDRLRGTEVVEFHSEVETKLSEHFLERRDFDKAARVLEHHVATHAAADITPDTYFNLGYIHFFNQRVNKSRRFLELYVEQETDAARSGRARKILAALDRSSAS